MAEQQTLNEKAAVQRAKPSSKDALIARLQETGWTFTVTAQDVVVPDTDKDYASRYSSRARYGVKQVPGYVVSFRNGVSSERAGAWDAEGNGSCSFTEDGKYLAKHTRGSYPIGEGVALSKVLEVIANRAPAEVARRRESLAEQREAEAAEKIAQADAAVTEAASALSEARAGALFVMAQVRDVDDLTDALDLVTSDSRMTVFLTVQGAYERATNAAQYARNEYQRMEQRGWL